MDATPRARRVIRWATLFLAGALCGHGQSPGGEVLDYDVEWRLVPAGRAKLSWSPNSTPGHGGEAKLHLESTGLVSRLFHVNDDYTSTLGSNFCAETTFLTAHEGSRNRETKVTFDGNAKKAIYLEKEIPKNNTVAAHEIEIPACVHDIVGGLYFLRSVNVEPGHSMQIPVSDGKRTVSLKVEAQGREDVNTPLGVQKTLKYEIFAFNNVLYRRPAHLHVWLTEDRRKLPVQIEIRMQFTIGTVTLRLNKETKL